MEVHLSLGIFIGAGAQAARVADLEFPALPKVGLIPLVSSLSGGRNDTAWLKILIINHTAGLSGGQGPSANRHSYQT